MKPKKEKKPASSKCEFVMFFQFLYNYSCMLCFLYSVPLDPELRAKWRSQICQHQEFDEIPGAYPVCMLHFDQSKIKHQGKRTTLVKGTLPTVFPG